MTRITASSTPRASASVHLKVETLPGFPETTVHLYGVKTARTFNERLEQAYFVAHAGKPIARSELESAEKAAINCFLEQRYPEHAKI